MLDKWTANSDGRQAVFSKRAKQRRYTATFIDQGYCFNAGEWTFPDSPLRGVFARNCVYSHVTGWNAFEPALTRAEEMSIDAIWQIAREIPAEWYEFDSAELERLVEAIFNRRSAIRSLIQVFRTSSRNPFPQWVTP